MAELETVVDPFTNEEVQISNRLVDRLRGKYACGPHLPNGNPEFGWRQFQSPPIQHEAADRIEALETVLREIATHPTGGVGCNPVGFVKMAQRIMGNEQTIKPISGRTEQNFDGG